MPSDLAYEDISVTVFYDAVPVKATMPEVVRVRHSWGKAIPHINSPDCFLFRSQGELHASLQSIMNIPSCPQLPC